MFQRVPADWVAALDDVANELLERGGMQSPPVDCLALADCLRIHVAYDASQSGRARHKRIGGQSTVLVRPEDRPERLQWAVAHELGEAFAWRVFERVDADVDEGKVRHNCANTSPISWRRDCCYPASGSSTTPAANAGICRD